VNTLFNDDFTGPTGQLADPTKWGYEVGANIRNNELQYYTDADPDNASLDGAGNLRITVRKESFGGAAYTSALLWTQNKFTFTTGCLEARIKTPVGSGLWPAFWTLGVGTWPTHGEVDVMEEVNSDQLTTSNLHGGPTHWSNYKGYAATRSAWHIYKACLSTTQVTWYLDGALKHTYLKTQMPAGQTWPFGTTPQYILLNVAMGGSFPGTPNGTATLPATMLVDYVRVTTT
jgi:beta-glucanase (GH16 family)